MGNVKMDIKNIENNCKGTGYIELSEIRINQEGYGCSWSLLQAKIHPCIDISDSPLKTEFEKAEKEYKKKNKDIKVDKVKNIIDSDSMCEEYIIVDSEDSTSANSKKNKNKLKNTKKDKDDKIIKKVKNE